jgi:cytochrome bd-type quinol oxidase subunit 2
MGHLELQANKETYNCMAHFSFRFVPLVLVYKKKNYTVLHGII